MGGDGTIAGPSPRPFAGTTIERLQSVLNLTHSPSHSFRNSKLNFMLGHQTWTTFYPGSFAIGFFISQLLRKFLISFWLLGGKT